MLSAVGENLNGAGGEVAAAAEEFVEDELPGDRADPGVAKLGPLTPVVGSAWRGQNRLLVRPGAARTQTPGARLAPSRHPHSLYPS